MKEFDDATFAIVRAIVKRGRFQVALDIEHGAIKDAASANAGVEAICKSASDYFPLLGELLQKDSAARPASHKPQARNPRYDPRKK